jgi:hypothetical protein
MVTKEAVGALSYLVPYLKRFVTWLLMRWRKRKGQEMLAKIKAFFDDEAWEKRGVTDAAGRVIATQRKIALVEYHDPLPTGKMVEHFDTYKNIEGIKPENVKGYNFEHWFGAGKPVDATGQPDTSVPAINLTTVRVRWDAGKQKPLKL